MIYDDEKKLINLIRKDKLSNYKNTKELFVAGMTYLSKIQPNMNADNPLTVQETLCLILLACGKSTKQCADMLDISPESVTTYEKRMRKKVGAKNRTHLFYLALIRGYVTVVK